MPRKSLITLLILLLLTIAAILLWPRESKTPAATATPDDRTWLETVESVRSGLRQSPDHYPARMAALIEAGDAEGIIAFVATLQPVYPYNETTLVHGPRGALRGGLGTPADLAQLLAESLQAIGKEATVVGAGGQRTNTADLIAPRHRPAPTFPAAHDADLTFIGGTEDNPWTTPDLTPAIDAATTAVNTAHENATLFIPEKWNQSYSLPRVALSDGDTTTLIDPLGIHPPEQRRAPAPARLQPRTVKIELLAEHFSAPGQLISLLESELPLPEISGRHIDIAFLPPADSLEELELLRPASTTTFLPAIAIGGADVDDAAYTASIISGNAFDLSGNLPPIADLATAPRPTRAFYQINHPEPATLAGSGNPDAVATLADLTAHPGAFPEVRLNLRALDADDRPVEDLPATAIHLAENGNPVSFRLLQAHAAPPRVLFLGDASGSMPEIYRGPGQAAFVTAVATGIQQRIPQSEFSYRAVAAGRNAPNSPWTSDIPATAAVATRGSHGSPLWEDLAHVAAAGASVIVFTTDAEAMDTGNQLQHEPTPDQLRRIRNGPPVIVVLIEGDSVVPEIAARMAELTGGTVIDGDDQPAAITALIDHFARQASPNLALAYRAPADGPATRTVEVAIGKSTATTSYELPGETEATPLAEGYSGLYLRLTSANGRQATRTLAGRSFQNPSEPPTERHMRDVHRAMIGSFRLHATGGEVPLTTLLDDHLAAWPAFAEAAAAPDSESAARILRRAHGIDPVVAALTTSLTPPDATEATLPINLQYILRSTRLVTNPADPENDDLLTTHDLIPLDAAYTVDSEGNPLVQTTLRRTLRRSALEATLGQTNAAPLFQAATLTAPRGQWAADLALDGDAAATHAPAYHSLRTWRHLTFWEILHPPGPPITALAIDKRTGTAIALIPESHGGTQTRESVNATFDRLERTLDATLGNHNDVRTLFGAPASLTSSFWANFEKAKLKQLRVATIAIVELGSPGARPPTTRGPGEIAEDTMRGFTNDRLGDAGDAIFGSRVATARAAANIALRAANAIDGGSRSTLDYLTIPPSGD